MGGDSYQKLGVETLPHLLAISPGLPLLFLESIMQKGKKNEERNLNAWDRSFEYATQIKLIVVVNINHTAQHAHTHNIYPWLRPVKSGGAVPPHFSEWGGDRPPCPPYVSTPVKKRLKKERLMKIIIPLTPQRNSVLQIVRRE